MMRNRDLNWGIQIRRIKILGDMGPGILSLEMLEFFFSLLLMRDFLQQPV